MMLLQKNDEKPTRLELILSWVKKVDSLSQLVQDLTFKDQFQVEIIKQHQI